MLERLPDLFSWAACDDVSDAIDRLYLDAVSGRLGRLLRRVGAVDEARCESLRARVEALPPDRFVRFLRMPQLFYHVSAGGEGGLAASCTYLEDSLDAEELRTGGSRRSRGVWTGLGDQFFPASGEERGSAPDAAAYRAPRLPNGVPVDFASPYARGKLPEVSGEDADFTPAELRLVLDRLEEAVVSLAAGCAGAHAFVTRFSQVLLIRKDPGPDAHYTSASSQLCIGRPILRNPHLPGTHVTDLADGWVHETIHSLIDIIELARPMVADRRVLASASFTSPWTGRSLDLNTYLQACFVWYGLWKLWFTCLGTESFSARAVLGHMARASHGFTAGDVTRQLIPVADALDPGLIDTLRRAQESVASDFALVEEARAGAAGGVA